MPARIRPQASLTVTFYRDSEELESQAALTGERALKVGLLMLAKLDDLQAGDRLTVRHAADGTTVRGLPRPQGGGR